MDFALGLADESVESLSSSFSSLMLSSSFFTPAGGLPNVSGSGMLFLKNYPRRGNKC